MTLTEKHARATKFSFVPEIVRLLLRVTGMVFAFVSCVYMMAFFVLLSRGKTLIITPDGLNPIEIVIAFIGVVWVGSYLWRFFKRLFTLLLGRVRNQ